MGLDALVDGPRALVAVRGDLDPAALARDLVRRDVTAVGYDRRGTEPWQVRDALAGAERACLVAAAAGPPVRHGSELGALGGIARDVLAGERIEPRLDEGTLAIVEALVATGWSKAAAARRLGISRQGLYERIATLRAATASTPTCRRPASSWPSRCGRCAWASWPRPVFSAWPA